MAMQFGAVLGLQDKMTAPLRKASDALGDYGKQTNKAGKQTDKLGKSTNGLSLNVKKLAASYVTLQGIKAVTKTYADFEDSMLRVKSLVGDASDDEFKALTKQAKSLGASTAFSASQVAAAQGELAQSGQNTNQIMNSTTGVLNLASAASIGLAKSANLVSSSLNIFGLEADQAGRVSDVIATAQAKAAGNAEFFGSAIANVGGSASAMGFSLEQTVGVLETLAPTFNDGGSAGTAYSAILRDMSKNQDKLAKSGVSVVDAAGNFRQMDDIVAQLTKTTEKMTLAQKKQFLSTAFGDEAIKGVNALLTSGAGKIQTFTKGLNESAGGAKTMADVLESGLGGALRGMSSATEGAVISLGEFLLPVLKGVVFAITGIVSVGNSMLSFLNGGSVAGDILTAAIWGITAALTANKIATLLSSGALAGYLSLTSLATLASGALTGALKLLNLSNPFGWIALAITGIVILYKRSEKFRNLITGIIDGFKSLGKFVGSIFGGGGEEVKPTANGGGIGEATSSTNDIVNKAGATSNKNSNSTKVDISGNNFTVREEADIEKIAGQLADEVEKRQGGMKK